MRNCLKADLLRVQRKKAYIIMITIVFVLVTVMAVIAGIGIIKGDKSDHFKLFESAMLSFNALMIGIPVFSAILSDDFKSRSMQTAIGRGMSRRKLIFTRFLEFIIVVAEAFFILTLAVGLIGMIFGIKLSAIGEVVGSMWLESVSMICYFSISMIFVYWRQNGTIGLVLYIILSLDALNLILVGLNQIPFIKHNDIDLVDYTVPGMREKIMDGSLAAGSRVVWGVAVVFFYIIVPLFLTMRIFRRRELDF